MGNEDGGNWGVGEGEGMGFGVRRKLAGDCEDTA